MFKNWVVIHADCNKISGRKVVTVVKCDDNYCSLAFVYADRINPAEHLIG